MRVSVRVATWLWSLGVTVLTLTPFHATAANRHPVCQGVALSHGTIRTRTLLLKAKERSLDKQSVQGYLAHKKQPPSRATMGP